MIKIRKAEDRGHAEYGWLDTWHTFSFADYRDPAHMGFRALRVINDDRIASGAGFGMHGHRDMEIVTYLVSGALAHRDSMGNGSVLGPGDVQRMTAGTGVEHSEKNPSLELPTRLLQIWILPERSGLEPGYEERHVAEEEKRGRLALIATRRGGDGALRIHQDVDLYATLLAPGGRVEHKLRPGRHAWIQLIRGTVDLNGRTLEAGDGAALTNEDRLVLRASDEAEGLLFDLA